MSLTFRGTRRNGTATVGRSQLSAVVLVQKYYALGFRNLEVENDITGELVGQIDRHPDTGQRIWWAAS